MVDFDVRIISMKKSEARRAIASENFREVPYSWKFFDAISGLSEGLIYEPWSAKIKKGRELNDADLGCYSSHYFCILDFLENTKCDYRLILEDDVLLDIRFSINRATEFMRELNISYLRLYSRLLRPVRMIGSFDHRVLVRFEDRPFGTQAYIISREGARKFLRLSKNVSQPVDQEIDEYWRNGLTPYALFPFPALELQLGSTISVRFRPDRTISHQLKRSVQIFSEWLMKLCANVRLRRTDARLRSLLSRNRASYKC